MTARFLLLAAALLSGTAALAAGDRLEAAIGAALFERVWIPAPASTRAADGLGPAFNARSCAACHPRLGRAEPDTAGRVVRLSDARGRPDPIYGAQVQTEAAPGHVPEARIENGDLRDFASGALGRDVRAGFRLAPALSAVGALAAVPESAILARADPADKDGDGISGRANRLPDGRIGRFGWKASHPNLREQVAAAFSLDLGLSSAERPAPEGDCFSAACRAGPHGGTSDAPEMKAEIVTMLVRYLASRRPRSTPPNDPHGAHLFAATGCALCHAPETAFTDLLLHDMGPGLDGGATEPGVSASEWRTAPLLGLSRGKPDALLHDGRAHGIAEAVRLHGGEGDGTRKRFEALSAEERARLIRYVESL